MDYPFQIACVQPPPPHSLLMMTKDCTERLSAVALSIGLIIRAANAFGIKMPSITENAWEDAEHGLGMVMSTLVSEKNRELFFIGKVFKKSDISGCCFTSISRARPPENRKF